MNGLLESVLAAAVLIGFLVGFHLLLHRLSRPSPDHPLFRFPPRADDPKVFNFARGMASTSKPAPNGARAIAGQAGLHLPAGPGIPACDLPWPELEFPGDRSMTVRSIGFTITLKTERDVDICRDVAEHGRLTRYDEQVDEGAPRSR